MEKTLVYACRTKDREILAKSSSGGAFTAISDYFLDRGDAVLCSSYDYDGHRARFGLAFTKEERDAARGSMYMQSYALDSWKESLMWLRENPDRKLLFTGTGCQAAAFRNFMKMNEMEDRAFIVDLVCHGAPSPKIWREYARSLEREGKLSDLNFKNKKTGWSKSVGTVCQVRRSRSANTEGSTQTAIRSALHATSVLTPGSTEIRISPSAISGTWRRVCRILWTRWERALS